MGEAKIGSTSGSGEGSIGSPTCCQSECIEWMRGSCLIKGRGADRENGERTSMSTRPRKWRMDIAAKKKQRDKLTGKRVNDIRPRENG